MILFLAGWGGRGGGLLRHFRCVWRTKRRFSFGVNFVFWGIDFIFRGGVLTYHRFEESIVFMIFRLFFFFYRELI